MIIESTPKLKEYQMCHEDTKSRRITKYSISMFYSWCILSAFV